MGRSYASVFGYGNESDTGWCHFPSIINNRWNNKGPFNAEAPSGIEPTATTALAGAVYHPEIASSEWRHPKCGTCNMNTQKDELDDMDVSLGNYNSLLWGLCP